MPNTLANLVYWHAPDLIHPDDFARLDAECHGLCFLNFDVVGKVGSFLIVDTGKDRFRIHPEALRPLPNPEYVVGQRVRTLNGTKRRGWIRAVGWHFMEERHYYLIDVEGINVPRKRVKRRYWQQDLAPL